MTAGGFWPKSFRLEANPQTIPVAICCGDGLAAADGNELLNWKKRTMKTNLLNRFELELAMLHRIYRCMDENELAVLFEKVTGHSLNEWDNKRNVWQCDVPFEHLVSADVGTALDFLTNYWERHEVTKNFVTRSQQNGGECNHEWVVFSTALQEVCLMVECVECGAFGTVDDPTKQEWRRAFSASSHPYGWAAKERVTVRGTPGMRHVERVR